MFSILKDIFSAMTETKTFEVNPANGLPMIEDTQIDVSGNFYGFTNDTFGASDTGCSFSTFD